MGDGSTGVRGGSRVLMIGVDSMSLPFARAHLDQLPALKSLLDEGALVEPETCSRYFSASSWTTFISGTQPAQHGQYYPFQWDAKTLKFRRLPDKAWRAQFAVEPFWYDFARAGLECTVLDAGFVLDDKKAPCRQITNWSYQSTGDADASDPALLSEIRRRFGHRPIGAEVPVPKKRALCQKLRDDMIEALRRKGDAVLWLMDRHPWQFFLAGFYEIHRAGHNIWPIEGAYASEADPDALLDVYKAQDRELQRILSRAQDGRTTFVLFSLHGMKPNYAQDHFLKQIMSRLNACYLAERGQESRPKPDNLMTRLRKLVPYELQAVLAGLLGEQVQDWVVNRGLVGGLDWARTPAFHLASGGEGYIRFNIKGREAKGFFELGSKSFADYVKWLEAALLDIRVVGTGEPLITSVARTSEIMPGTHTDLLPDLILQWGPEAPAERIVSDKIGEIHERLATGRGGNHLGESFVVVSGPGANNAAIGDIDDIKDLGAFARSCLDLTVPIR